MLAELVRDGVLTLGQAAEKAGMTEKDFQKAMDDGKRLPEGGGELGNK